MRKRLQAESSARPCRAAGSRSETRDAFALDQLACSYGLDTQVMTCAHARQVRLIGDEPQEETHRLDVADRWRGLARI